MKFKIQTNDWTTALQVVSSVTPTADKQGCSGYLCVLNGGKAYLYSEDGKQRVRAPLPVFDVEGEGAFVFPTGPQGDLRYVDGWVEFEAGEEAAGANIVWCRRDTGGAKGGVHKIISFSPKALRSLDADLASAVKTSSFPSVLLKEAIVMTRSSMEETNKDGSPVAKPEYENLQLFGADDPDGGNGYMLGCSESKLGYLYSPDLEGKSLFVYGPRIPLLLSFLAKSPGSVDVYHSKNSTYFMNAAEQVLGWSDQDYDGRKFGYYEIERDRHIFKLARVSLEKELRYVYSTLPPDRNKAFCSYDHRTRALTVLAGSTRGSEIESVALPIEPLVVGDEGCWGPGDLGKTEDIQFNINLKWLIQMVEATKHPRDVILAVARGKKGQHMIRIIEDYFMDENGKYVDQPTPEQKGYACRAQRYIPSKQ